VRAAAVLHVPRSPHASVAIGYEQLARRMRERGHSLEIVTPADLQPRRVSPRLNPVLLPLLVRRWVRRRPDLDLIIFHSYTGWLAGRPRPGLRTVVAFHGFEPLFHQALAAETARRGGRLSARYALMYGRMMPRMLRRACRAADLVLCLNGEERAALVDGGYARDEQISLVWNDAPQAFFQPHDYRPRAAVLLAVMQWLPTKGTAYLVEAFTALARAHGDLRLVIAGTLVPAGTVRADFPPDVRGRVDVRPTFVEEEHRALLAAADIFVHPTVSEGFSRAVIEAMAAGVPVVTTRTGFAVDRLASGEDAVIVPVADAAALATAVDRLVGDAGRRARVGRAGQVHAARLRAEDGAAHRVALFESLLARPA
jgi:glycosyltransferase involved in cell wall biosynthesis